MESATAAPMVDTVATLEATGPMEATMARGRLSLLLLLRLKPTHTMALTDMVDFPMEATDVLTEATGVPLVFLLTDALTVATDVPMEATDFLTVATDALTEDMAMGVASTARGRLRLLLSLRLRLRMDTDADFLTEAMDALTEATDFPTVATDALMEDMVATDVATMVRGKLRLLLRLRLLTDTAMAAAMEAMAAPMEDTVATGPMVATAALMA